MSWACRNDNFKHVLKLREGVLNKNDGTGMSLCGVPVYDNGMNTDEDKDRQYCPNTGCAEGWAPRNPARGGRPRHECPDCGASHVIKKEVTA